MFSEILLFLTGLVLICLGGDRLLNCAVSVSGKAGVPPIVIGATIVSLCTTLPEILVSTTAIFSGSAAITVGNAIGSVICNTGLIAGIAFIFSRPMKVDLGELLWRGDFFILVLLGLMIAAHVSGSFGTPVGLALLFLFAVYAVLSIVLTKDDGSSGLSARHSSSPDRGIGTDILMMAACAVFLFVGARLLVTQGISLAAYLGIPERAIAVTAIALGTSLPELTTTIISLLKHYEGISLGNVTGANILNLLLVIGIPSTFARVPLESQTLFIDMPLALLVMLILTVPIFICRKSARWQGVVLLLIYAAYCVVVL